MLALNELENAKAEMEQEDAARLHRLRREVVRLEDRVEGDGWKKAPKNESAAPPPTPKDRSGKSW